jgi:Holliday junction resolvase RusA-like endonuclease
MPRIRIVVPYKSIKAASKNIALKRSAKGMYKSKAAKTAQEELWYLTKRAINVQPVRFHEAKVWLRIMVYRPKAPDEKGRADLDPINILDTVADAIKYAVGVDDKWFASVVDWAVDKENPRVEIVIEQEAE